jgi:SAM-dependent methyltransferase
LLGEDTRSFELEGIREVPDRPDLYDWLYDDFEDDVPMYVSFAKPHTTVLECGIGTGRIAIPLAESGKIVYGIDNSQAMLQLLERKLSNCPQAIQDRIHYQLADMRDFDLGRTFSLIYVPFSTFNYLMLMEDQKASLRSFQKHLEPQGTLVLELLSYSLYPGWLENEPVMRKVKEGLDTETGSFIEMWKTGNFDSARQIATENRYFRFHNSSGELEKEEFVFWQNRFFFLGEIQLLLEATGFEITNIYGDFKFGPYRHRSESVVVVSKPLLGS